jgi:AmmeMemoRadiSam system protein B
MAESPVNKLPRMRNLDVTVMETEEGGRVVALRDPEGICGETVMLAPAAFVVASLLDGKREVKEIQALFAGQFEGHVLTEAEISDVVTKLDGYGMLETPSFAAKREAAHRAFSVLESRPASHAGTAYPADTLELTALLRDHLKSANQEALAPVPEGETVRGLVLPHIDFERGGKTYGMGHRLYENRSLPGLVVVLGVAHAGGPEPFITTRKDYETPYGRVKTDIAAIEFLEKASGRVLTSEEYAHRLEHSIEFQLAWLQGLHRDEKFTVLPVLVSDFGQFTGQASPLYDERIQKSLDGFRALVAERKPLVIASVDLSHVGPRFGDDIEPNEEIAGLMKEADHELLAFAEAGDAEAFWVDGMRGGNERHVDAISAVYALLRILGPRVEGKILGYDQAPDPAGGIVSFAAMAFR